MVHRWGGCWGEPTHSPGSEPGLIAGLVSLASLPAFPYGHCPYDLSRTVLASSPVQPAARSRASAVLRFRSSSQISPGPTLLILHRQGAGPSFLIAVRDTGCVVGEAHTLWFFVFREGCLQMVKLKFIFLARSSWVSLGPQKSISWKHMASIFFLSDIVVWLVQFKIFFLSLLLELISSLWGYTVTQFITCSLLIFPQRYSIILACFPLMLSEW